MTDEKLYRRLAMNLCRSIPAGQIFTDPLNTLARGTDAGFYRLVPRMVVRVENEEEVIALIQACSASNIPLTFKAGGTSLSGQTITDSVLVEIGDGFTGSSIINEGRLIKLKCGITGGLANLRLVKYGRRLGPDPSSMNSAKIGGIVANNASGGAFGISHNSYHTLRSMRIIFADGCILDTLDDESRKQFIMNHPEIMGRLISLSSKIKNNHELASRIRHKYELKNTCGFGLNALLDFTDPIDILFHLMVGSEGTLGFISEVTYETVENPPLKATALIYFPSVRAACETVSILKKLSINAGELMDRNALRSVQDKPGMPEELKGLNDDAAALLIDITAYNQNELSKQVTEITQALSSIRTLFPVKFTADAANYEKIWKVRKGLFTSAAATRPAGTACIIEDLAFRYDVLADAIEALKNLIEKHNYSGSVIWGHILDGNIHFVIMPDFRKPGSLENYREFMNEIADLTIQQFDGSLKGEHGTGRNMAPFVLREWGNELYQVMKEIKQLLDPLNILNPGVILNTDPEIHLKNIKSFSPANSLIDPCIECGFCEINCPSKSLTLTPRQRIVIYRELMSLSESRKISNTYNQLRKGFNYHADETCATDGLCAINCPVDINTGTLIKDLRYMHHSRLSDWLAGLIADNMKAITSIVRNMLNFVGLMHNLLGTKTMSNISRLLRSLSFKRIPSWNPYMPKGAKRINKHHIKGIGKDKVVYFPTCINRSMGKSHDYKEDEPDLIEMTDALLRKAGFEVIYPEGLDKLCCGMAFSSKGFKKQADKKARELETALMKASSNGSIPVYCDMSPCLFTMKETLSKQLKLYEPVEFILEFFPGRLTFIQLPKKVAIHSTCSSIKMALDKKLVILAGMCAREVVIPDEVGCCGWAGDRGFTHPELNASALKALKSQLPPDIQQGFSTSRTCEIGLSLHSGISYKSIVYLVNEATRHE
jgi:D-lactate dehydrogenase